MKPREHRIEEPAYVSLTDHFVYLMRDRSIRPFAQTEAFLTNLAADPTLLDGRLVSFYRVDGPEDVHYPTWEMHPEGDELLILVSGSIAVEFLGEEELETVPLPPNSAFVVPAGIWHRLVVNEPSVLIAITPPHGTVLEEA